MNVQDEASRRPIIVVKKKVIHSGHHGGAWKVAYADFVTALLSLFIVLWLMNSTPQVKKAVGGYFSDPRGQSNKTGTDKLGAGSNISIDKSTVEALKAKIEKAILKQKNLETLSKQVEITITGEGLRMELIEGKGGTFYDSGSPQLNENGTELLRLIAAQLQGLPNKVTIEGHTDAQPYAGANGYTNWELSADRANAARRVLQEDGLEASRVSEVRGFADQVPRAGMNPMDPSNRRIALVVKWVELPSGADGGTKATSETGNAGGDKTTAASSGTSTVPTAPAKLVVVAPKPGS